MKIIYLPYDDFKMIMNKCLEFLSLKFNIFGYEFELTEIIFYYLVLCLVICFVHFVFTHQ